MTGVAFNQLRHGLQRQFAAQVGQHLLVADGLQRFHVGRDAGLQQAAYLVYQAGGQHRLHPSLDAAVQLLPDRVDAEQQGVVGVIVEAVPLMEAGERAAGGVPYLQGP